MVPHTLVSLHLRLLKVLFVSVTVVLLVDECWSFQVPDLPPEPYMDLQEVNLGLMLNVRLSSREEGSYCQNEWTSLEHSQLAETLPYLVRQTNTRADLLPNITLGYVVLDTCRGDVTALAKSLFFLPKG